MLDGVEVQAQFRRRWMVVDDGDAKADKRMHLTGKELYVFGFPRIIRHQATRELKRIINASGAGGFRRCPEAG